MSKIQHFREACLFYLQKKNFKHLRQRQRDVFCTRQYLLELKTIAKILYIVQHINNRPKCFRIMHNTGTKISWYCPCQEKGGLCLPTTVSQDILIESTGWFNAHVDWFNMLIDSTSIDSACWLTQHLDWLSIMLNSSCWLTPHVDGISMLPESACWLTQHVESINKEVLFQ